MSDAATARTSAPTPALSLRRMGILALLVSLAFVVLLAVPLFGDPRTIYAAAFISGQNGSFPENISYPFCMRGFGYKCLYYGLYRAADVVVDSRSTFAFELVTRLFYYSGFVALAAWFFWLLRERLARLGVHWLEAMFLFLVAIVATSHHIHQQPEELAVLLTVGLTAFSLSDNKLLSSLSGLFIPLLIFCKILTVWPAVFPLFMVLATRQPRRIFRVGASWAAFFAATILFYVAVIPQEIVDLRNAALCQSSTLDWRDMRALLTRGIFAMGHIPFYFVTCVCLAWLLWRAFEWRKWKECLLALAGVVIAAFPLVPQTLYLCYHYLLLFPPAFLIVLWCLHLVPDAGRRGRLLVAMAISTFAGWGLLSSIRVNPDSFCWLWIKAARHQDATLRDMDRKFHLNAEPDMLFLAPGDANYVIRTKPSSRYFAPVILQRACFGPSLRKTALFQDMLDKTLAYRGTYIYVSDWLPLDRSPEVQAKLKAEYEPATPKIEQFYPLCDVQLFRRKADAPTHSLGYAEPGGSPAAPKRN